MQIYRPECRVIPVSPRMDYLRKLRIIQQRAEGCTRLIFTFRFDSRIAAAVAPRFLGVRRISSANHIFSGSVTFHPWLCMWRSRGGISNLLFLRRSTRSFSSRRTRRRWSYKGITPVNPEITIRFIEIDPSVRNLPQLWWYRRTLSKLCTLEQSRFNNPDQWHWRIIYRRDRCNYPKVGLYRFYSHLEWTESNFGALIPYLPLHGIAK